MKSLFVILCLILGPSLLSAHDHIEVRRDPLLNSRLAFVGNSLQLATFFPTGESPSYDLPSFPGGAYCSQLTFSAFDNTSPPLGGAFVRVEILSVVGPSGGTFSYWNTQATTPTWTRPVGWSASLSDQPFIAASEDNTGYGHIHGRLFTMNRPGVYDVTFQAVDTLGNYATSLPFVIRFEALATPQLSIEMNGTNIELTFQSRENLVYDLQSTTTLQAEDWTTIGGPLDGTGTILQFTEPLRGRPKVFFRLVEYQ